MATQDLSPLYRTLVGFDRISNLIDQATRHDSAPGYPPFNVEQVDENAFRIEIAVAGFGEDEFRIELAVAGFSQDDLSIEFKQNSLLVSGQRKPAE